MSRSARVCGGGGGLFGLNASYESGLFWCNSRGRTPSHAGLADLAKEGRVILAQHGIETRGAQKPASRDPQNRTQAITRTKQLIIKRTSDIYLIRELHGKTSIERVLIHTLNRILSNVPLTFK